MIPTLQLEYVEVLRENEEVKERTESTAAVSPSTPTPQALEADSREPLAATLSQAHRHDQSLGGSSLSLPFNIIQDLETMTPALIDPDTGNPSWHCGCICNVCQYEGDMIFCTECEKWSHMWCYGFTSRRDPRLPKRFLCVSCCHLLKVVTPPLLKVMASTAAYRYAVAVAWREGSVSCVTTQFAKRLGVTIHKTKTVLQRLESDGFLTPLPSPAKHNKRQPKRTSSSPSRDKNQQQRQQPQKRQVRKNASTRACLLHLFRPNLDEMAKAVTELQTRKTNQVVLMQQQEQQSDPPQQSHTLDAEDRPIGPSPAVAAFKPAMSVTTEVDPITEDTPTPSQTMSPSSALNCSLRNNKSNHTTSIPPVPLYLLRRQQQVKQQQPYVQELQSQLQSQHGLRSVATAIFLPPSSPPKVSRTQNDQALGEISRKKRRKVSKEQESISVCE